MTKPTTHQGTPNIERDGELPESDNPSDHCDFGYVLVKQLKENGVAEAHPKRQSELEGQFDPAEHWGKA